MQQRSEPENAREIVVVTAADDAYAMPLAVTVRSALNHLGSQRTLRLYVLDGGIRDETKSRLLKSWADNRLAVDWVGVDPAEVNDLMISHQVNHVTYFRVLMAHALPQQLRRAIYLDADMLIRRDLGELWDEEQGVHAALAVQDIAAPYLDAAASLSTFARCRQHLAAYTPIMNFRELGLPPDAEYFNGGVMVVDLERWRRERFGEQMLDCLRRYRQHVLWWDQYALNVVLCGKWRGLDYRWNQGAHIFVYPHWRENPLERRTFAQLRSAPWIVHFCSPSKPWHYFCQHPFARSFYRCLDQTEWRGWRPERPADFWRRWWDHHYQPLRKRWKAQIRAAKQVVRENRRRAA